MDDGAIDNFMTSLMGLDDKAKLTLHAEKSIDITLKYMQIMYYAHEMERDDLFKEFCRRFEPAIKIIGENMSEEVRKYQAKHGEI